MAFCTFGAAGVGRQTRGVGDEGRFLVYVSRSVFAVCVCLFGAHHVTTDICKCVHTNSWGSGLLVREGGRVVKVSALNDREGSGGVGRQGVGRQTIRRNNSPIPETDTSMQARASLSHPLVLTRRARARAMDGRAGGRACGPIGSGRVVELLGQRHKKKNPESVGREGGRGLDRPFVTPLARRVESGRDPFFFSFLPFFSPSRPRATPLPELRFLSSSYVSMYGVRSNMYAPFTARQMPFMPGCVCAFWVCVRQAT